MEDKKYVYVVVTHQYIAWNLEHNVDCVFESEKDAKDYCERAQMEHKKTSFVYYKVEFNKK